MHVYINVYIYKCMCIDMYRCVYICIDMYINPNINIVYNYKCIYKYINAIIGVIEPIKKLIAKNQLL